MADLLQALADGLFNFLLVFETFLDILDSINFLDSGYSLLVLFYSISLVLFIVRLFNDFVMPDQEENVTVDFFNNNDETEIFNEDLS